jgi:TRAP-type C4-dicarboxylate transport system permease small subunit
MTVEAGAGQHAERRPVDDEAKGPDGRATWWRFARSKLLLGIAAASLFLLMLVIAYDVVARYFLNSPTRWAFEVSKYFMATMVMAGAAHAMAMNAHIRVEVLYDALPSSWRRICDVLAPACGVIFCVVLAWQSAMLAWRSWIQGAQSLDTGVPLFIPQALVPVGSLVLAIQCVIAVRVALTSMRKWG